MRVTYPFSAILENRDAKIALKCALSSKDIDSVLICGHKGTGKSVLARSIATIVSDRKIITVPLNSTEEQIFGGIDLEKTLSKGKRELSNSLLLRADENILFIDNINLMPESTMYQLLNIASGHQNIIEREGISYEHYSRYLLIATMDPEEGALSNHMLDRFDLCVFTSEIEDEDTRIEIVKRRMEFDRDPKSFMEKYSEEDQRVSDQINATSERVRFTIVPDGYCGAISGICNELNVAGHRGDISMMNVACALAAMDGRDTANLEDLKQAAVICLEHRRNDLSDSKEQPQDQNDNQSPDDNIQDDNQGQDEDSQDNDGQNDDSDSGGGRDDGGQNDENRDHESSNDAENQDQDITLPPPSDTDIQQQIFSVGDTFRVRDYLPDEERMPKRSDSGRRSYSKSDDRTGRCIGYMVPKGKISDIALYPSIRAAAPYQRIRDRSNLAIVMTKEDLREKVREKKQGNKILFLVDGSGSIGAQKRMVAVKGAILSLLKDAYQKRDEIGMIVFRKDTAEEILPMTKSVLNAYNKLEEIPTGGRTPLVHGLIKGYDMLKSFITRDCHPVMIILTDGRNNVSFTQGVKPLDEMISTARSLADTGIRFVVIDTEVGSLKFGLAMDLCKNLNGTYLRLEELNADYLERSVRLIIDSGQR